MRLKKITVLDSCGNANAAVVDISVWADLGCFYCPPGEGVGGTVIKIELVLDVPNNQTVGYPQ